MPYPLCDTIGVNAAEGAAGIGLRAVRGLRMNYGTVPVDPDDDA